PVPSGSTRATAPSAPGRSVEGYGSASMPITPPQADRRALDGRRTNADVSCATLLTPAAEPWRLFLPLVMSIERAAPPSAGAALPGTQASIRPVLTANPQDVAPPLDRTVATTLFDAVQFLYIGAAPIQHNVAPGAITRQRVAVLRGRV